MKRILLLYLFIASEDKMSAMGLTVFKRTGKNLGLNYPHGFKRIVFGVNQNQWCSSFLGIVIL